MKKRLSISLVAILLLAACGKTYEDRLKECDEVGEFHDGYALCKQGEKYFYIDKKGRKIAGDFDKAGSFANGYAIAWVYEPHDHHQLVVVDKEEKKHIYGAVASFDKVNKYGNLWICLERSAVLERWELLNVETGSPRTPIVNGISSEDEEGNSVVWWKGRAGYMLYNGKGEKMVEDGRFKYMGRIVSGRILFSFEEKKQVENNRKCGYLDTKGRIVIPAQFPSTASEFSNLGYAYYATPGRTILSENDFHYYDTLGRMVSGKERYIAQASFRDDGKWVLGKDDEGRKFFVNNKGEETTLDAGSRLAVFGDIIVSKKGKTYTIYQSTPEEIKKLFTLNGTGNQAEVLAYSPMSKGIELINGRTCETFSLDGSSLGTTQLPVGINMARAYENRKFNFE
ncbi:MAG: WG repeat-containing protein [Aeriscardovia sp.]|nr:WG repeat-containing protein [Aeriscardovia sp.]MBP3712334.1 WG repeat-containing protein [Bacteroidaceae bacterium]MBQ9169375.1 WG repeat-containing protein [Bacteroidaceae bacterium]MBQ9295457.1 WG repeat-containing protein [Bacteroidaceae bacterium]